MQSYGGGGAFPDSLRGYQGGHGTTAQHEMMTVSIATSSHVPSTYTASCPFTSS